MCGASPAPACEAAAITASQCTYVISEGHTQPSSSARLTTASILSWMGLRADTLKASSTMRTYE
eukprot:9486034-Pyramimonas_sp.AAC.3